MNFSLVVHHELELNITLPEHSIVDDDNDSVGRPSSNIDAEEDKHSETFNDSSDGPRM
jgi:hypothetical protein